MTASLFGYFAVKHQIYSHLTYNFSKNTVEKGKTSPKLNILIKPELLKAIYDAYLIADLTPEEIKIIKGD
jgi:hypothetical protein